MKISVLIPIYNGAEFLQQALDSLYQQSFSDFEIVIIDDGSTDDTAAIIESQKNAKIRYYKNEVNSGIVYSLNKGLQLCHGEYIARMDADDIALPQRLAAQLAFMEAHLDCVICGSSINRFSTEYSIIDERGADDKSVKAKLFFDTTINHPSAMLRRSIIANNQLSYPKEYLHAEDYAFWYELSQFGTMYNLEEVLIKYRMHGANLSMQNSHKQYQSMNKMRIRIANDFWKESGGNNEWMGAYTQLLALDTVSAKDMAQMDQLLMTLLAENKRQGIYDPTELAKAAAWFWYVVFIHEHCQKFHLKMILNFLMNKKSICSYLDITYKRKFFIKSLLLWRKKV